MEASVPGDQSAGQSGKFTSTKGIAHHLKSIINRSPAKAVDLYSIQYETTERNIHFNFLEI